MDCSVVSKCWYDVSSHWQSTTKGWEGKIHDRTTSRRCRLIVFLSTLRFAIFLLTITANRLSSSFFALKTMVIPFLVYRRPFFQNCPDIIAGKTGFHIELDGHSRSSLLPPPCNNSPSATRLTSRKKTMLSQPFFVVQFHMFLFW